MKERRKLLELTSWLGERKHISWKPVNEIISDGDDSREAKERQGYK